MKKLLILMFAMLFATNLFAVEEGWNLEQNSTLYYGKTYEINYIDLAPIDADSLKVELITSDTVSIISYAGNYTHTIGINYLVSEVGTFKTYFYKNPNGVEWVLIDSLSLNFSYAPGLEVVNEPIWIIENNNRYFKKHVNLYDFEFISQGLMQFYPGTLKIQYSMDYFNWNDWKTIQTTVLDNNILLFKTENLFNNYPDVTGNFKLRLVYLDNDYTLAETEWIEFKTFETSYFQFLNTGNLTPYTLTWNKSPDLTLKMFIDDAETETPIDEFIVIGNSVMINNYWDHSVLDITGYAENQFIRFIDKLKLYNEDNFKKILDSLNEVNENLVLENDSLKIVILYLNDEITKLNEIIISQILTIDSLKLVISEMTKDTTINLYYNGELQSMDDLVEFDNIPNLNFQLLPGESLLCFDILGERIVKYDGNTIAGEIDLLDDFYGYKYILLYHFEGDQIINRYKIILE